MPWEGLMTGSILSGLTGKGSDDAVPVAQTKSENAALARIDFAHVANHQFFVYGWILGFTKSIQSASIHLGSMNIDLLRQSLRVRRPDIVQHLSLESGDDQHGFYVLMDLPENFVPVHHRRLSILISSGKKTETHWAVAGSETLPPAVTEPYLATFSG